VVDLGCGDWRCGNIIYENLDLDYTGIDIYEPMIISLQKRFESSNRHFLLKNIFSDEIPSAQLLVIKDVLQHWYDEDITTFLDKIVNEKRYKYVLVTNCSRLLENRIFKDGDQWFELNKDYPVMKKYDFKLLLEYRTKQVLLLELL